MNSKLNDIKNPFEGCLRPLVRLGELLSFWMLTGSIVCLFLAEVMRNRIDERTTIIIREAGQKNIVIVKSRLKTLLGLGAPVGYKEINGEIGIILNTDAHRRLIVRKETIMTISKRIKV